MPQYWAGIVNGKIDSSEVDSGFGGWGDNKHRAPRGRSHADELGVCEHGNSVEACLVCEVPGDECGRWYDGKLDASCSKAGTEECDFECPYRNSLKF